MTDRVYAGSLRREDVGRKVSLAGWVQKRRDFGELIFVDLRDRSGICQVVVDRERGANEQTVNTAKELRSEFVVRIEGQVVERAEGQRNAKLATGDVELVATGVEILSRSDTPPFPIEDPPTGTRDDDFGKWVTD